LASRRRRRKSIGKVIVDVERRVRRVEKRPGAKRLKTNVVTTEKLGFRAVSTKTIQPDAVTANEAEFGVTVVSATDPAIEKEGTTVVDPTTGAQKVYSTSLLDYIPVTDPTAQATADSKNATYYQDAQPAGGTYEVGDMWVDTNDDNKLYTWDGSAWALTQDSATAADAAQSAYNAAIASLQPSASTIVNASNQITAVNTNGITVYSGGSATTGARIVMNSAGIAGFDATSTDANTGATFSISASTGAAVFKGSIQSGSTISGTGITGSTITGGTIKTAASGQRIELVSTSANNIYFYDNFSTNYGLISVTDYALYMYGPGSDLGFGAKMQLYSDQNPLSSLAGLVSITAGGSGDVLFTTTTNNLRIDGATTTVSLTNSTPIGTYGLRNVRGFTIFDPATNSSGGDGDIAIVYS
jgi:hypothetical protein